MKRLSFFGLVYLFVFLLAINADALGIRIDKPKVWLTIPPGGYESGEISVENSGDAPIEVKVYLEDWVYNEQGGGKAFLPPGTHPLSCSPWITFYPAEISLAPRAVQNVRYTINVPKDAKGGYYSVMFFETGGGQIERTDENGEVISVEILNRLGALFYVRPEGTIVKEATLENLGVQEKLNDLVVTADLTNVGNVNITASGTFNVIDGEGFVFARGEFDEVYTLPQDKATLQAVSSSTDLKAGTYDLLITLEFEEGGVLVKESQFNVSGDGTITLLKPKS